MTPEKERAYKIAQHRQANMPKEERIELANLNIEIKEWIRNRMEQAVANPPTGILFDDETLWNGLTDPMYVLSKQICSVDFVSVML